MSWKKNWFSYPVWFIYVVVTGIGLICLAEAACDTLKIQPAFGIGAVVLGGCLTGLCVFLIHRFRLKHPGAKEKKHIVRTVAFAAVSVVFLAIGLVLRIQGIDNAGEKAGYFEVAAVTAKQGIPALVHGAEYFYIQLLHKVFFFIGNKFTAGVWLQILLQFGAILILFFSVRYTIGQIAAIVMLGFSMFSPYMIQESLDLSPEMVFLFLWSLVFAFAAAGSKGKLKPMYFLFAGFLVSFITYVDVAGVLLLFLVFAVIFCERDIETGAGKKLIALLLCIVGFALGFTGYVFVDSCLSAKSFSGVLEAWLKLYRPETLRIPVSVDATETIAECAVLLILMTAGVFSFWCDRRADYRKAWILGIVILVIADCYGVFTDSIPGGLFLYLLLTLLAGVSLQECFPVLYPIAACDGGDVKIPETESTEKLQIQEETTEETSEETTEETECRLEQQTEAEAEPTKVQLIENPLPLPKKHEKRVLGYDVEDIGQQDDFDIDIDENDDFDI